MNNLGQLKSRTPLDGVRSRYTSKLFCSCVMEGARGLLPQPGRFQHQAEGDAVPVVPGGGSGRVRGLLNRGLRLLFPWLGVDC